MLDQLFGLLEKREVGVPEWLSGMTRNHVGSARAGSNPAAHGSVSVFFSFPCLGY